MKKLIKKFREWRDERFRQRIDRVYFRNNGNGIRIIEGWFCAVPDYKAGLYPEVWVIANSDIMQEVSELAQKHACEYRQKKGQNETPGKLLNSLDQSLSVRNYRESQSQRSEKQKFD